MVLCCAETLLIICVTANRIYSKRLVSFLPEFIDVLKHHGHLTISSEIKSKLLSISTAMVNRLLKLDRQDRKKNLERLVMIVY